MSRRSFKVASFVAGIVLALATGAAAAIIIYDLTATGSVAGSGITLSTTHVGALTYSANGAAPALDANATVLVPVKLTNNDPGVAHPMAGGLTTAITGSDTVDGCASHLSTASFSPSLVSGSVVPAGSFVTGTVGIHADGTIPLGCSGSTYTVTFTGVASS